VSVGVVVTLTLWAMFVHIAVRGTKTEIPDASFGTSLAVSSADQPGAVKILLPIDGSLASVAAVHEVAHCPLPPGSTIELLYAIHSRLPVIPDFPPWAVTLTRLALWSALVPPFARCLGGNGPRLVPRSYGHSVVRARVQSSAVRRDRECDDIIETWASRSPAGLTDEDVADILSGDET
jgi:hypothetical protein